MQSKTIKKISLSLTIFILMVLLYFFAQDWLQTMDVAVSETVRQWRQPMLDRFFLTITILANSNFVTYAVIVIVLVIAIYFKQWLRAIIYGLAIAFGNLTVNPQIKNWVHRERPDMNFRMVHEASYSFPSGHAFASAMIYPLIADFLIRNTPLNTYPRTVYTVTTVLVLLISFSRIYLGMHYLSDVIAGMSLGYTFYLLTRDLTDKVLDD
ncbi:phosphatase PAP2 family protein [Fundicoccus culcitae]|uniref:Phosphatase PAP2 family protein n=1 Tax=Fundicoccus culcitae TaxID=2969821 RepID=A0ABY5P4A8_9LACT|nr:phosphatase PAP2 family protein [Fundicoccus culcitae]UUX33581.1 phosphatase PAP2 family protein [Fundicoccus culcitae]